MPDKQPAMAWPPGFAPVSVVMIALNEGHNIEAILENLMGWAQEVFIVDSYSQDDTVGIALRYGVNVVQRRFKDFGDQWNFALSQLPIKSPWVMKLDPDERLSGDLKMNLCLAMETGKADGFAVERRLWFMGKSLPVHQRLIRVWRTGKCRFTDIAVNEHPIVQGTIEYVPGVIEHHDSPDLDHWLEKQNRYTSAEAIISYQATDMAVQPRLFGKPLQRRMWLKRNFNRFPFRYQLLFLYHWLLQGAWRAGWVGLSWAHLRVVVMRLREYKTREMHLTGRLPVKRYYEPGKPDERVRQYE